MIWQSVDVQNCHTEIGSWYDSQLMLWKMRSEKYRGRNRSRFYISSSWATLFCTKSSSALRLHAGMS